jgi:hypothetical protein
MVPTRAVRERQHSRIGCDCIRLHCARQLYERRMLCRVAKCADPG